MPRSCTICEHTDRDAIEDAFIAGAPKRRIASQYGVSERAVRYHLREHLPVLLALARDAERASRADSSTVSRRCKAVPSLSWRLPRRPTITA
jgi:FixJ family two-component response regulator